MIFAKEDLTTSPFKSYVVQETQQVAINDFSVQLKLMEMHLQTPNTFLELQGE